MQKAFLVLNLLLCIGINCLSAATLVWPDDQDGHILTPNAWGGSTYANGDQLRINDGTVLLTSGNYLSSNTVTFHLAYDAGSMGNFNMLGGNLHFNYINIGASGDGNMLISGGNIFTDENFRIGQNAGSTGNVLMTGGNITLLVDFQIGKDLGTSGNLIMDGGDLSVRHLNLADAGEGYMILNGGNILISENFRISNDAGSSGTFIMNEGYINVDILGLGDSDYGLMTMTGGNIEVINDFRPGSNSGGDGNLIMTGGNIFGGGTSEIKIANNANSVGNMLMTGGIIDLNNLMVGNSGSGFMQLDGGLINLSNDFHLANSVGAFGNMIMNGGDVTSNDFYVGDQGLGYMVMNHGEITVANDFASGQNAGSGGSNFLMNYGIIYVSDEFRVGQNVSGNMTMYGGNVHTLDFYVGTNSSGNGDLLFLGGNIFATNDFRIANEGNATMLMEEGYLNIAVDFVISGNDGTGNVVISGGNIDTAQLKVSNTTDLGIAYMRMLGGNMNVYDEMKVGNDGYGILIHNSGNISTPDLRVGHNSGSNGNLILDGGLLNADASYIGYNSNGNINLLSGTFNSNDTLVIGHNGNGILALHGGTLSANNVSLSNNAGSVGNLHVNSGNLSISGTFLIAQNDSQIRIRGGANLEIDTLSSSTNNMVWEHILTTSIGKYDEMGLAYMTNSSTLAEGDLKIGVESGLMLSDNMSYYLQVGTTQAASDNYDSKPNMWDISLVDNVDGTKDAIVATLASANKMSSFDINGTKEIDLTNSTSGWVSIENLDPAVQTGGVYVYLNVTGAVIQDLIDDFNALGYTAQTTEAGSHDIEVLIPASFYSSGTTYLTYDFRNISTGQATARLSQLQISATPLARGAIFRLR